MDESTLDSDENSEPETKEEIQNVLQAFELNELIPSFVRKYNLHSVDCNFKTKIER